jgi:hypothetical protein
MNCKKYNILDMYDIDYLNFKEGSNKYRYVSMISFISSLRNISSEMLAHNNNLVLLSLGYFNNHFLYKCGVKNHRCITITSPKWKSINNLIDDENVDKDVKEYFIWHLDDFNITREEA